MSDLDISFFGERRKVLNDILAELENLFELRPPIRRLRMTDMKMNILLHKLAFMVKQDNDIFLTIFRLDEKRQDHIYSLALILAEEIRKIKGVNTSKLDTEVEKVKNEVKELAQFKSTLNLMKELEPHLREALDKRKKWKKDNK